MLSVHMEKKKKEGKNTEKFWEVLGVSVTMTVVIASQVFSYIPTQKAIHIEHVQPSGYQGYLGKIVLKRKQYSTLLLFYELIR